MKKYGCPVFCRIVVAIFSLFLISSSVLAAQEKKEKKDKIKFKWSGPVAEEKTKKEIEKGNDKFVEMLDKLRKIPDGKIEEFIKKVQKDFQKTYLKDPTLKTDKEKLRGWESVIPALKKFIEGKEIVEVKKVVVYIKYKAYDEKNKPKPEEDIDYEAHIKTVFSCLAGDFNDDFDMYGDLEHRRPCYKDD